MMRAVPRPYRKSKRVAHRVNQNRIATLLFYSLLATLVAVPLTFSTAVHRIYVLPRFAVLLFASSLILVFLTVGFARGSFTLRLLVSRHSVLVLGFFLMTCVSTAFGVAPVASLFGSFENQMGLITRLSFVVCFAGVVITIGQSIERFQIVLWTLALTGLFVACYATAQFFGYDPFVPAGLYSFESQSGTIIRVIGTLGHSNYLGNFLLYTTPISAALAVSTVGRARRIALMTTILSGAAIAFSGTRGAWLGLITGALTFVVIERRSSLSGIFRTSPRQMLWPASVTLVIIAVLIGLTLSTGASRSLMVRARSFVSDSFSGSGRVLLWKDSLRMVSRFSLAGCGPEGFRRAFLEYKSKELAQLAPQINNESPHSSYLDAAISIGLPGLVFYIGMIASAFSLLWVAGRRASRNEKILLSGLISALAGVAVHNLFIFDQIPTGLYFITAMGLALAAANVIGGAPKSRKDQSAGQHYRAVWWASCVAALTVLIIAAWYVIRVIEADVEIKRAFAAASAGKFNQLMQHGSRAASAPDPTDAYHFAFAQALSLYLDATSARPNLEENARAQALDLATREATRPLAHTLTPDSDNLLLAYLSYVGGNTEKQHYYAAEALKWDRYYPNSHWLLAHALLSEGDREGAVVEAERALDINPSNQQARALLKDARGTRRPDKIQELIEASRSLAARGLTNKAERFLIRAIRRSDGKCPECHRELAQLYEARGDFDKAIAEWEIYLSQVDQITAAGVREHIAELRQKHQPAR